MLIDVSSVFLQQSWRAADRSNPPRASAESDFARAGDGVVDIRQVTHGDGRPTGFAARDVQRRCSPAAAFKWLISKGFLVDPRVGCTSALYFVAGCQA